MSAQLSDGARRRGAQGFQRRNEIGITESLDGTSGKPSFAVCVRHVEDQSPGCREANLSCPWGAHGLTGEDDCVDAGAPHFGGEETTALAVADRAGER